MKKVQNIQIIWKTAISDESYWQLTLVISKQQTQLGLGTTELSQ